MIWLGMLAPALIHQGENRNAAVVEIKGLSALPGRVVC